MGEFELIFETILDYESGDQMGSFDAKKTPLKISCLGTFKAYFSYLIAMCFNNHAFTRFGLEGARGRSQGC
jgi:hypothetical protein